MRFVRTRSAWLAGSTFAALLTLAACGSDDNNANPGASTPASSATPAPVSGTQPAPNPTPTPSPSTPPGNTLGASCQQLSPASGTDRNCREEGGRAYQGDVEAAIMAVSPEHMSGNEIVSFTGYRNDVVKYLDGKGICAVFEGDNLFVRGVGDDYNEYYDVITSTGYSATR
jgi:hypothetical protein